MDTQAHLVHLPLPPLLLRPEAADRKSPEGNFLPPFWNILGSSSASMQDSQGFRGMRGREASRSARLPRARRTNEAQVQAKDQEYQISAASTPARVSGTPVAPHCAVGQQEKRWGPSLGAKLTEPLVSSREPGGTALSFLRCCASEFTSTLFLLLGCHTSQCSMVTTGSALRKDSRWCSGCWGSNPGR